MLPTVTRGRMKNAKRLWLLARGTLVACRQEGPVISGLPDLPFDTTGIIGAVTGSSTLQQRMTALDQLQSIVNGLAVGKFAGNTTLLVQAMRAMPQFATAGSGPDGTVWGIFKGGIVGLHRRRRHAWNANQRRREPGHGRATCFGSSACNAAPIR